MSELFEVALSMMGPYLNWNAGSRNTMDSCRKFVDEQMDHESSDIKTEVARRLYDLVNHYPFN